jgi:DNA-binding IclR family transcriptional regulator
MTRSVGQAQSRIAGSHATTGLKVVEALSSWGRPAGPSELGRALSVDKSVVHRVLQVLAKEGWVLPQATTAGGQEYVASGKTLSLGNAWLQSSTWTAIVERAVTDLATATGESVQFAEWRAGRLVCVACRLSAHHLVAFTEVGDTWDIASNAAVAVAVRSADSSWWAGSGRTEGTASGEEETKIAAAIGYAVDPGRYREGVAGVAAPVYTSGGRAIGALVVSGPVGRVTVRVDELGGLVRTAARSVSEVLGDGLVDVSGAVALAAVDIARRRSRANLPGAWELHSREPGGRSGSSPAERAERFRSWVAMLDPAVMALLGEADELFLDGSGELSAITKSRKSEGSSTTWELKWGRLTESRDRATGQRLEPVTIMALLPADSEHGYLRSLTLGDWPIAAAEPGDGFLGHMSVIWAMIEAELYDRGVRSGLGARLFSDTDRVSPGSLRALAPAEAAASTR